MKIGIIGGAVIGLAAVGVYFSTNRTRSPEAAPSVPPRVAATATPIPAPPAPAVPPPVVDVLDLNPLLYPQPIPSVAPDANTPIPYRPAITAVGFEPPPVPPAPPSITEVKPIPPAVDEEETTIGYTGPLFLDMAATRAVFPERLMPQTRVVRLDYFGSNEVPPLTFQEIAATTVLGPLFAITDADLLKPTPLQNSANPGGKWVWVPGFADTVSVVSRVSVLTRVTSQAPTSRIEWYTRWYGDARVPIEYSSAIVEEQRRMIASQPKSLFHFGAVPLGGY